MTGLAEGFRGAGGSALEGRLFVTDGTLDRSVAVAADYTFEAGISGSLSGDPIQSSVVTGQVTGDFIGSDATSVSGRAFGKVISPTGEDVFDGSFAAAKN